MMSLTTKFKTLTLTSTIMLLTACNQPTKAEKPTSPTTANSTTSVTAATTDPQAGHNMNTMANNTASQPAHVTEYRQSMTAMHEQMMAASKIANPDSAFATGMMAHHQGAVEMAKIQLKYGKDSQMRALAEHIIKAQEAEIQEMQTWLTKHKDDKAPNAINGNTNMPEMAMKNQDTMMQGMMATDPDVAFAKGMIPHHQGAIDMANTEIKLGKDKAMLDLAKRIKTAQDPEIKQMQTWLDSKEVK